jgi:DNA-binding NarL/FixJ family response regulator
MQNDIKKKINNLFARGATISEISKTLELTPGEVSNYIRKIFTSKKQSKNLLKFPMYRVKK